MSYKGQYKIGGIEWEYSRTWRRHYIHDGEYYRYKKERLTYLWEIVSSAPYGYIQDKHGYDLYHKGKFIQHGETVKELKQVAFVGTTI